MKENDVFSRAAAYEQKLDEIDVPVIFKWKINLIEIKNRNTDLIKIRSHNTSYSRAQANFTTEKNNKERKM